MQNMADRARQTTRLKHHGYLLMTSGCRVTSAMALCICAVATCVCAVTTCVCAVTTCVCAVGICVCAVATCVCAVRFVCAVALVGFRNFLIHYPCFPMLAQNVSGFDHLVLGQCIC